MQNPESKQEQEKNPVELIIGEPVGGLHTWEMIGGETDREILKNLIPQIHAKAQTYLLAA